MGFGAQRRDQFYPRRNIPPGRDVLRPQAEHHRAPLLCWLAEGQAEIAPGKGAARDHALDQIDWWAAEEPRHKNIGRALINPLGRIELLDQPALHHRDPVREGHRLGLVMGDIDKGGFELLMQPLDQAAHGKPQRGIEVGERLIHQEDRRLANDGAAQRHALPLPAGKLVRPAAQQMGDLQLFGGSTHRALNLRR